jgi:hypothetical protein
MTPTGVQWTGCGYLVVNSHLGFVNGAFGPQNPPWQVLEVTQNH